MIIVEPEVEIWFHLPQKVNEAGEFEGDPVHPEIFLERAGRLCYKSEEKITTGSARKFIEMLDRRGHRAMLEHCVASVKFICDRGVTHELVRHRIASYAQESTRYCDYSKDKFEKQISVIRPLGMAGQDQPPIGFDDDGDFLPILRANLQNVLDLVLTGRTGEAEAALHRLLDMKVNEAQVWHQAMVWAEQSYRMMRKLKSPTGRARHVLPIGLKTEIWATFNLREWQHVFSMRCANEAHSHIRALMRKTLGVFQIVVPSMFTEAALKFGLPVKEE